MFPVAPALRILQIESLLLFGSPGTSLKTPTGRDARPVGILTFVLKQR